MRIAQPKRRTEIIVTILVLIALLMMCWLFYAPDRFGRLWYATFTAMALSIVCFWALRNASWLSQRPLVWLGAVSYSVYLFHMPLDQVAQWIVPNQPIVQFVIMMGLTLTTSALVHKLVEQPCITLGRKLNHAQFGKGDDKVTATV